MKTIYLQILSMTDHKEAFQNRYRGPYAGLNATQTTSEMSETYLALAKETVTPAGKIDPRPFSEAEVILAYRHTDVGNLKGTSESLLPLAQLPWRELPGLEINGVGPDTEVQIKLWNQEMKLRPSRLARVHFGKTLVYLRNFGLVEKMEWVENPLSRGPSKLHGEEVQEDLTIAPPAGSGFTVKPGQEIQG